MNTEYTQKNIEGLLSEFAGRIGFAGYDETKSLKIAECNRDFVWDIKRQEKLIKSILEGYPIPAITICNDTIVDGGNRLTTLWLFRNGHLSVEFDDKIINYDQMCENRTLARRWDACHIPQLKVSNATTDQISQIYHNLNQGVPLTFGQLLENRKNKPIVDTAMAMLGYSQRELPFRDVLNRVWYKPAAKPKKTKTRAEIGYAYQILMSSLRGPSYFNTNIMNHIDVIMSSPEDEVLSFENLEWILTMLDEVDPQNTAMKSKKKTFFRHFISAIIQDFYTMPRDEVKKKWQLFAHDAYHILSKKQSTDIINVGSKRANCMSRLQQLSKNVQEYLDNRRVTKSSSPSETESESVETDYDDEE